MIYSNVGITEKGEHHLEINKKYILDILNLSENNIEDRESEELEFKEQFSLSALPDYYRSFAGFANNKGGYLVFGVKDSQRIPIGLNEKSNDQFKKIDPQRITQELLEVFSANIQWEQADVVDNEKTFGVFKISEASRKPVIAKKNYGKKQTIRAGEIYYRYAGRTQKIQYAELEAIVQFRIEENSKQWMDLMSRIAEIGPQNAAVLKIDGDLQFEQGNTPIFSLDEEFVKKIKNSDEINYLGVNNTEDGNFGNNVQPIIGVIPKLKESLLNEYPLSATELAQKIKEKLPNTSIAKVWDTIKKHKMKDNSDYSVYIFRNKKQENQFKDSGKIPNGIPSVYNHAALTFILTELKSEEPGSQLDESES